MTQRISNAIDVFLKAIENGTLAKGTCVACAVGNLVAHGMGGVIELDYEGFFYPVYRCSKKNTDWMLLFNTSNGNQEFNENYFDSYDVISSIKATDFTWQELAAIEFAFETSTNILFDRYPDHSKREIRKDQIKGLEAVVQVMMDFDDVKESVQEVFTSKAELIAI